MVSPAALVYYGGGTVLFFFWAYGLVSFVLDVKNKFIPAVRQYLEARQERKRQAEAEEERAEKEKQLL